MDSGRDWIALLIVPMPMTDDEWRRFHAVMREMEPGLVYKEVER